MFRHTFLPFFTILSVAIGFLHITAIRLDLYWIFSWYDTLVHFLGGAWVASIIYIIISYLEKRTGFIVKRRFFWFALGIIVVGTLWEVFEYVTRVATLSMENYPLDTLTDLIADCVGTLSIYAWVKDKRI